MKRAGGRGRTGTARGKADGRGRDGKDAETEGEKKSSGLTYL